ncbi:MAG: hypothetical protein KatS3mg060_0157 [Dehalococcoidia bacterium]|nr:MAG: hypothetical protein KatS3mg060_0157 [Dehalococcoidia bacterium]
MDDDLLARLQAEYTDGQIMEIAVVCAVLTGMAKLLFAFDLGEREDYCPFPGHGQAGGWAAGG